MSRPAVPFPSRRDLLRAWLLLAGLTLATMVAGGTLSEENRLETLGLAWAAVLLLVTGLKAWVILARYLNLARATGGWKGFLAAYLIVVLTLVFGAYGAEFMLR